MRLIKNNKHLFMLKEIVDGVFVYYTTYNSFDGRSREPGHTKYFFVLESQKQYFENLAESELIGRFFAFSLFFPLYILQLWTDLKPLPLVTNNAILGIFVNISLFVWLYWGYFSNTRLRQVARQALDSVIEAANRGVASYQYALGKAYLLDVCGRLNYMESYKWYQLSSQQGYSPAQEVISKTFLGGNIAHGNSGPYIGVHNLVYPGSEINYHESSKTSYVLSLTIAQKIYDYCFSWTTRATPTLILIFVLMLCGFIFCCSYLPIKFAVAKQIFAILLAISFIAYILVVCVPPKVGKIITARHSRQEIAAIKNGAKDGDAAKQTTLGLMYLNGIGVMKDYVEAYNWILPAAKRGNTYAQYALYEIQLSTEQAPVEAIGWLTKAAEQGLAKAQYELGLEYLTGRWISPGIIPALDWLKRAAEHGHTKAQIKLGDLYYEGKLVSLDRTQAAKWYSLALSVDEQTTVRLAELSTVPADNL